MRRITIKQKIEAENNVSAINAEEAKYLPWLNATEKMHQLIAYKNAELQKKKADHDLIVLEIIVKLDEKEKQEERRRKCVIL